MRAQGLDFDGYGDLWTTYPMSQYKWPGTYHIDYTDKILEIANPYRPQIMDVIVDKYEHVWGAAWYYGGVMYDGSVWYAYPPSDTSLPNGMYDLIFADSKGNIWFGTNQSSPNYGFTMYDGKEWRTYYSPERYWISYVYQIAEDQLGNVWLATGGGLLMYDGTSFTLIDSENSPLVSNNISAVTADERGNIWIGTDYGLYVYNPNSTIELGKYTFNSPADSLTITSEGKYIKAEFKPNTPLSVPVKYQLQRGRGIHKLWAIAETEYYNSVPAIIKFIDSTLVLGKYYYRINEVTTDGKQRYTSEIQINGGTPGVTLISFEHSIVENQFLLRWDTKNETFLKQYEIWKNDSVGGQFVPFNFIQPDTTDNEIKHYEIQSGLSEYSTLTKQYSLIAVFLDSSRTELKVIDVEPVQGNFPKTFLVSNNYPNPFNISTNFDVSIAEKGLVTFKFYNLLGEEVRIIEQDMDEGYYSINIDFSALTSGVYFYTVSSFEWNIIGKLVLLK